MQPTDPFDDDELEAATEAFENSGQGQFLSERLYSIVEGLEGLQDEIEKGNLKLEEIVDSLEALRDEVENGNLASQEAENPNEIEALNCLWTIRREVSLIGGSQFSLNIFLCVLLGLILWRVW